MTFPCFQTLHCRACLSPVTCAAFSSTCAKCGSDSIEATPYHPPPPPPPPALPSIPANDVVESAVRLIRYTKKKKGYDSLKPTQRRKRKQIANWVLERLGVPVMALLTTSFWSVMLLTLSTSIRRQLRSADIFKLCCEEQIKAQRQSMATMYGTSTAAFTTGVGTYMTRPIEFVRNIRRYGRINIGGDAGGGTLKIGIIYSTHKGTRQFIPLIVRKGGDAYGDMEALLAPNLTPFLDESARFANVFEVLQSFINESEDVLLVGDCKFISTIVGHMGASSNHPCFICCVPKHMLALNGVERNRMNNQSIYDRQPLLKISPGRIVPPVLHIFLGIANKIIKDVLPKYVDQQLIIKEVGLIRTIHTSFGGGVSDLFDLNGSELKKFIKNNSISKLTPTTPLMPTTDERARLSSELGLIAMPHLDDWLKQLYPLLLDRQEWNTYRIHQLRTLVTKIHLSWTINTSLPLFPKLHMLHHCVDFVTKYNFLGSASESPIESFHASFNSLYNNHHLNSSRNDPERLRRCLADVACTAMVPFVKL